MTRPPPDGLDVAREALAASATPGELERWRVDESPEAWVLIAGEVAYKIFKREPAARAEAELALGRGLAPELYRDVVELCAAGRLQVALRMRAFERWQRLDRRAALGDLRVADVEGLGAALAAFHRSAPGRAVHGALSLAKAVRLPRGVALYGPAPRPVAADPIDDLAALALDVQLSGSSGLAWRFLNRWLAETGDTAVALTLPPHVALHGLARAAREPAGPVLAAALRFTAPVLPVLVATVGPTGAGKTTVSTALAAALEAWRVDGSGPELHRRVRALASGGRPVVVDSSLLTRAERDGLRAVARARGIPLVWLACRADADALEARVRARLARTGDPSEDDLDVLERQRRSFEPLDAAEGLASITVPTDRPVDPIALARRIRRFARTGHEIAGTMIAEESCGG